MQVIKKEKKEFKPIELTITIENEEELDILLILTGYNQRVSEKIFKDQPRIEVLNSILRDIYRKLLN